MKLVRILTLSLTLWGAAGIATAQDVLLEDFKNNPQSRWTFFADTVMGGTSTGQVAFLTQSNRSFVRLSGEVSTANNGGFIQTRASVPNAIGAGSQGLRLNVRGNGETYFIHIRTRGTRVPWQYYQASFPTTAGWNKVDIPFSAFERSGSFMRKAFDPGTIRTIGIVAFGRDHTAALDVESLALY